MRPGLHFVRGLLLLAVLAPAASAAPAEEPPKELARDTFAIVTDPAKLPPAVQAAWAKKLGQEKLHVAAAGAPFQATDVIMDASLPGHRLVNAGVSGRFAVVHYESGGVGRSRHVLVFSRKGDTAAVVWSGVAHHTYTDSREFLDAIRSGALFAPAQKGTLK